MKKVLFTLVVVGLSASGLFAQLSGGIRGGLNISNQKLSNDDDSESFDSKIGFHAGGYLTSYFNDKFAIQPEVVYSLMGGSEDEVDLNFGYIAVPVYLRYNITEMFNVHAGPQASFLMSAKAKADGDSEDIKDSFKGVDFGASFGVGVDVGKFNGGVRYYAGLSSIVDEDDFGDVKWKNNAIQIFVGFKLFGE